MLNNIIMQFFCLFLCSLENLPRPTPQSTLFTTAQYSKINVIVTLHYTQEICTMHYTQPFFIFQCFLVFITLIISVKRLQLRIDMQYWQRIVRMSSTLYHPSFILYVVSFLLASQNRIISVQSAHGYK